MQNDKECFDEEFIIWNPAFGVRDFVMIGKVEEGRIWLDEPYEMVGPLDLEELYAMGEVCFAACMVMTEAKWLESKVRLQEASWRQQQKAQQEFQAEINRRNRAKARRADEAKELSQKACRQLLCLPVEGRLSSLQIKIAYRKIAKEAHPDVGGSQKHFIKITNARDYLMEVYAASSSF